jgi:hypothetical protein
MPNPVKSASEIKALVTVELRKTEAGADIDPEFLVVLGGRSNWMVTLRHESPRIDEVHLATVSEVSQRLATGYDFAGGTQ